MIKKIDANGPTLKALKAFGGAGRRAAGQFLREVRGYRLNTLNTADPTFDPSDTTPRINLLLLGSGSRSLFGGTATAIRFLSAIERLFPRSRVVVIAENEAAFEPEFGQTAPSSCSRRRHCAQSPMRHRRRSWLAPAIGSLQLIGELPISSRPCGRPNRNAPPSNPPPQGTLCRISSPASIRADRITSWQT